MKPYLNKMQKTIRKKKSIKTTPKRNKNLEASKYYDKCRSCTRWTRIPPMNLKIINTKAKESIT